MAEKYESTQFQQKQKDEEQGRLLLSKGIGTESVTDGRTDGQQTDGLIDRQIGGSKDEPSYIVTSSRLKSVGRKAETEKSRQNCENEEILEIEK